MRQDKLLELPNSFEQKYNQLTEKERVEKLKREAIEIYYLKDQQSERKSPKKKEEHEEDENTSVDSDEKHQNFLLENYFHLHDRLTSGLPDMKKEDADAFAEQLL